jgi:osmotically-inducible protein OsmY
MAKDTEVERKIRAALMSEARIDLHRHHVAIDYVDGTATLEGEVADVAAKKLALERTAALAEVTGIIDRVRVAPAQKMRDHAIRDHVRDALVQEPAFADYALTVCDGEAREAVRRPDAATGSIEFSVAGGVVVLNGELPGLVGKRLAGVLAWWVPGSRDVINGIAVTPFEEDSDDAIADAVALVLEKDPFVDAGQIRIGVRRAVVSLTGLVPTESEREMAEFDAWYVFGVDAVDNRIEVHP